MTPEQLAAFVELLPVRLFHRDRGVCPTPGGDAVIVFGCDGHGGPPEYVSDLRTELVADLDDAAPELGEVHVSGGHGTGWALLVVPRPVESIRTKLEEVGAAAYRAASRDHPHAAAKWVATLLADHDAATLAAEVARWVPSTRPRPDTESYVKSFGGPLFDGGHGVSTNAESAGDGG